MDGSKCRLPITHQEQSMNNSWIIQNKSSVQTLGFFRCQHETLLLKKIRRTLQYPRQHPLNIKTPKMKPSPTKNCNNDIGEI